MLLHFKEGDASRKENVNFNARKTLLATWQKTWWLDLLFWFLAIFGTNQKQRFDELSLAFKLAFISLDASVVCKVCGLQWTNIFTYMGCFVFPLFKGQAIINNPSKRRGMTFGDDFDSYLK